MTELPALLKRFIDPLSRSAATETDPGDSERETPKWVDPRGVGLHDDVLSGWFQPTGELFTGFKVTEDDIVLDAGCGEGGLARYCGMQGAHVILADRGERAVGTARRVLEETDARLIQPIVSDCSALPLPDGAVSKVIATEMLEHVDDPPATLKELVRIGQSGALYLLTVPDPAFEALHKQVAPAAFYQRPTDPSMTIRGLCPGHLRVFEHDAFAKLVTDANLLIEHRAAYGFFWSVWFTVFWSCDVTFSAPRHPILDDWARTWKRVLDAPEGPAIKKVLDAAIPKSQLIIARKP